MKKRLKVEEIDITYPLIQNFAFAHIYYDKEKKELIYEVIEPKLTKEEEKILNLIKEVIIDYFEVDINTLKDPKALSSVVENAFKNVLKDLKIKLDANKLYKISYYIYRDFVGFNEIEPLLNDGYIEDISCSGVNIPIYVLHSLYGNLKTNIIFDSEEKLKSLILKFAQRSGRYVTYAEPLLEATLPDGSRVSATFVSEVSTRGPSFTIRKFREKPFSIVELIQLGTLNSEIAAYLWFLIEHRASILIIGGVGSGKTTLLTCIGAFFRPEAKIVSIEDTRELRFVHEHWTPLLTRTGFGIPLPSGSKYGEVTLFDLLRESFRMNPDYVIVGETRGKEAYVMFQGMASGHAALSTFHAENVDALVKRLIAPPIELPVSLLESLDLVISMTKAKEISESARRIREITEIVSVDKTTGEIMKNIVFVWNPFEDKYERMNESQKIRSICLKYGITYENALKEIEDRKRVIDWLVQNNKKEYKEVAEIIKMYYLSKETVMNLIEGKITIEEAREIAFEEEEKTIGKLKFVILKEV